MPAQLESQTIGDVVVIKPTVDMQPPSPYASWCDWAMDGLKNALQGINSASGGVLGYGIGSRHVRFSTAAEQQKAIDWWNQMVIEFCGIAALPQSVTGRDTAMRVIP